MARRTYHLPHGEGSFYQRGDGVWVGALTAGWTERGTRKRITVTSRDKAAAWDKLTAARKRVALGEVVQQTPTVKQWADQWLELISQELRPGSYKNHDSRVRKWIVPRIGGKRLDRLTPADVRGIHAAARDAGSEPSTVRNIHATLLTMLRAAVVEGHVVPAPVLAVRKPAPGTDSREAIPLEPALRLVRYVSTLPDGARWIAALLQGMRQSECLGLTWDMVDFDTNTITVAWQTVSIKYADKKAGTFTYPTDYEVRQIKGTRHLARPKTRSGWRVVPMVPWMRSALLEWRERAPENPWGLVWPRDDGTNARDSQADRDEWHAILEACNIRKPDGSRYVPHEARNTASSLLLSAGVDVHVVVAIMGHSSVEMTRHYQTASPELVRSALESSAALLQLPGA